jgi:hypothetical protein
MGLSASFQGNGAGLVIATKLELVDDVTPEDGRKLE